MPGHVHHQVGAGLNEVVVLKSYLAGVIALLVVERVDIVLFLGALRLITILGMRLMRARLHPRLGVRYHHGVLAVGLFEEVEHPFFFHQPRHEIEIRFPVLDEVFLLLITRVQRELEIAHPAAPEYVADDVLHGHVLIDPAVVALGEKPEPGHQFHLLGG